MRVIKKLFYHFKLWYKFLTNNLLKRVYDWEEFHIHDTTLS